MKVTIPQEQLAAAAGWAASTARIGASRPQSPVLAGLLLTAEDGTLTVAGYDYEVSALVRLDADTGEPGRVLVSGRMLAQAAAILPVGRDAVITTDGTRAVITAGQVTYTLMLLPHAEFPGLPEPGSAVAEFGAGHLASAVAQVIAAASHDDTLPALCCIRLHLGSGGTATFEATDRYRFASATCPYKPLGEHLPGAVLVPARELAAVAKRSAAAPTVTFSLPGSDVRGPHDTGVIGITAGSQQITVRLISGEYPKAGTIRPAAKDITATLNVALDALTPAVKRAAVVAERNTPVRLAITPGAIRAEAGTGDEAGYAEDIPAGTGDTAQVAFNPRYLLDVLAAIDSAGGDTAHFALTSATRPAIITGNAPEPVTCQHILMPIRSGG